MEWDAKLVSTTSMMVVLLVDEMNLIKLKYKAGNCMQVGCGERHE